MQNQTPSERKAKHSPLAGAIKTALWLCVFIALGWVAGGPLFKGKSDTTGNSNAGTDSWLVGEANARVKELSRLYTAINFNYLSDFYYHSPDPWGTPDPELVKKSKIPDDIKALNGRKVSVSGFMMPINADPEGATEFVLNGNYDMCGFGGPVSMNEWMLVKYVGKGKVPYTHLPMTVFGTLEVGEEYRDGRVYSLYRLQANAASTPKGVIE
ncbi:MAG: DUF3299 domain-containing protein [Acidobacteria bacterium]|nr:DUF3299 domain-containing protein [Acidobacteriota bacterium]